MTVSSSLSIAYGFNYLSVTKRIINKGACKISEGGCAGKGCGCVLAIECFNPTVLLEAFNHLELLRILILSPLNLGAIEFVRGGTAAGIVYWLKKPCCLSISKYLRDINRLSFPV